MNIISFSGGKDSTALILWAKENLENFTTIFCDTGWEHEITYRYIEYINQTLLDGKLVVLKSDKYDGFEDMAIKRKRVPSVMARFCTQELKLFPTKKYIAQFEDVHLFVGIRAEESAKRAQMDENVFDEDYYKCWIHRPLLKWPVKKIFGIMFKHGIEPNPLYMMGMSRVGCFPCIMVNNVELKQIFTKYPETIVKIREIEKKIGRSFFSYDFIPHWACSGFDEKSGKKFPWIDDVYKYIMKDTNQLSMFEAESCLSWYGLCE